MVLGKAGRDALSLPCKQVDDMGVGRLNVSILNGGRPLRLPPQGQRHGRWQSHRKAEEQGDLWQAATGTLWTPLGFHQLH